MRLQSHIERVIHSFTFREKILLIGLSVLCIVGFIGIMSFTVQTLTKRIPEYGGDYREGFVGSPTTPIPILASTDSDKSVSSLIYSGILKKQSWNNYVPDIGQCEYNTQKPKVSCTIRTDVYFHDGKQLTTSDIAFTVELIQKLGDKSPLSQSFAGVIPTIISPSTIEFTLPKQFSGFEEALSVGIMPKHIWNEVSVENLASFSLNPDYLIGTGVFSVRKKNEDSKSITSILFDRNAQYYGKKPYLDTVSFYFFTDTNEIVHALQRKNIDGALFTNTDDRSELAKLQNYEQLPVVQSEIYGIFTKSSLTNEKKSLQNIVQYLPKNTREVFGLPWDASLPPWNSSDSQLLAQLHNYDILNLSKNLPSVHVGNQQLPGNSSLITVNQGNLTSLGNAVFSAMNAQNTKTELQVYDFAGFKNTIIPERKFGYLIFGQRYRHISDAFAYWNSGERIAPGLNITETVSLPIDTLTEQLQLHSTFDQHYEQYKKLSHSIDAESVFRPLFLNVDVYVFNQAPFPNSFLYTNSSDRFNTISNWYIKTKLSF